MITWTRGGSLTLAASPSLLFSNLSSLKDMVCFVRLSEVIVTNSTTEQSHRIALPKLQIFQAAMVSIGNSICVAVASNQGMQDIYVFWLMCYMILPETSTLKLSGLIHSDTPTYTYTYTLS